MHFNGIVCAFSKSSINYNTNPFCGIKISILKQKHKNIQQLV